MRIIFREKILQKNVFASNIFGPKKQKNPQTTQNKDTDLSSSASKKIFENKKLSHKQICSLNKPTKKMYNEQK